MKILLVIQLFLFAFGLASTIIGIWLKWPLITILTSALNTATMSMVGMSLWLNIKRR